MAKRPRALLAALVLAAACSSPEVVAPVDETGGAPTTGAPDATTGGACASDAACNGGRCVDGACRPATATDGAKNGDETDVDCGGATAPKCGDGRACGGAADCASGVCAGGACAAPGPTDGVRNGDETDVDCGGATAPKCAATRACKAGADCASGACPAEKCAEAPSCAQRAGGATCGPGEVGDPAAQHEDCCASAVVPRPAASGGPFRMDKYLVTAGRMRAFLEAVGYDVKGWVAAHRPAWWTGTGTSTWDAMLPSSRDEFLSLMTTGGSGCYIGATAGQSGAPAYWAPAADLARVVGGAPRALTQAELDTKVMNCFRAPLFHALCAFDGGRLPSRTEWISARTEASGVVRAYPWGENGTDADRRARAVYDFDYAWPKRPGPNDNDMGDLLPAPGRFPLGRGPYGHADLLGGVENMGSRPAQGAGVTGDGWFQFSFQEAEQPTHPYGEQIVGFGSGAYRNHWAVGARCVKLP